jgi:hypothetical protein
MLPRRLVEGLLGGPANLAGLERNLTPEQTAGMAKAPLAVAARYPGRPGLAPEPFQG